MSKIKLLSTVNKYLNKAQVWLINTKDINLKGKMKEWDKLFETYCDIVSEILKNDKYKK